MDVAEANPARPSRPQARRLLSRPELGAAAVVVAAWVLLIAADSRHTVGWLADMNAMAGMVGVGATRWTWAQHAWSQAAVAMPSFVVMTVAMMGPAALPGIRHTGLNSLRWRRGRAMAEFSAAYMAVWAAFGALALAAATAVPEVAGAAMLTVILIGAAVWQLTPLKRWCLRASHRSACLPPRGWRAELGALRFGLRSGLACLGSCWCLMLVMIVAPAGQLLWTAGLCVIVTAERLSSRPRAASRLAAAALCVAAVATAAITNLFR